MSAPITLTVPMPPNLANWASGRSHWRTKGRAKRDYYAQLDARQNAGLIPPPPASPLASVLLRAVMHLGAAMDDDNAKIRAYKWPADWLRTRGYIVDDKRPHCRMEDPEQIVKRGQEYRVEITLTPSPV